jgi:hypothetical protein
MHHQKIFTSSDFTDIWEVQKLDAASLPQSGFSSFGYGRHDWPTAKPSDD